MTDAPAAGRFDGRAHLLPVRIYYEDTDFTGLVYHANYLRYFERGRSDFLRLVGVDHSALLAEAQPTAFAVTRITVSFLKPARVDDALVVRTLYERIEGARLIILQEMAREGQTLARAEVEACCIAPTGRPKKPPPSLAALLGPYLAASASTF
jgi:acyl-CoA thioester hydrolase